MAKKSEKTDKNSEFLKNMNTAFGRVIARKLSDRDAIKDYVSTGSTVLDTFISNDVLGGWPLGKISVVEGPESSGKSLLAAHASVSTIKRDGVVLYIDSERAVDKNLFKRI
jgi:recombination protein RecA